MLDTLEDFKPASDVDPFPFRSLTNSQPASVEAAELGGRAGGARGGGAVVNGEAPSFAEMSARASCLSSAPPNDDTAMSPHSGFREEPVELLELVVSKNL